MQQIFDPAFPPGRLNYWKSALAGRLTDELIEASVEYARKVPSPHTPFSLSRCTEPIAASAKRIRPTTTVTCNTI
jgi:hypothetical protein